MAKKSHKNKDEEQDIAQPQPAENLPVQEEADAEALAAQGADSHPRLTHVDTDPEEMAVYPAAENPVAPGPVSNELAAYLIQQSQAAAATQQHQAHDLTSTAHHLMIASPLLGLLAAFIAVPSLMVLGVTWQSVCMLSLFALTLIPASAAFLVASTVAGQRVDEPMVSLDKLFAGEDLEHSAPHTKLELAQRIYDAEKARLQGVEARLGRRERALAAVRILLMISAGALAVSLVFMLVLLILQVA